MIGRVTLLIGSFLWMSVAALPARAAADEGASGANPLVFHPDLAIFSAIVFLVLLWILSKFAWPHIVAALEERERKIAAHIAAAEARHAEAERLFAEHQTKLAAAAGEIRELMDEAKRDAENTRRRVEEEGRQRAEEHLGRAMREIERAKDGAVQQLAIASANVAVDLAHKVVRDQLTTDQHSQLVREALGKLAATEPSKN